MAYKAPHNSTKALRILFNAVGNGVRLAWTI